MANSWENDDVILHFSFLKLKKIEKSGTVASSSKPTLLGFEIVFCTVGKEEKENESRRSRSERPRAPPPYVNPPAYDQHQTRSKTSKTKNVTASGKSTEEDDEEDSSSLKIAFEGLDLSEDESLVWNHGILLTLRWRILQQLLHDF